MRNFFFPYMEIELFERGFLFFLFLLFKSKTRISTSSFVQPLNFLKKLNTRVLFLIYFYRRKEEFPFGK